MSRLSRVLSIFFLATTNEEKTPTTRVPPIEARYANDEPLRNTTIPTLARPISPAFILTVFPFPRPSVEMASKGVRGLNEALRAMSLSSGCSMAARQALLRSTTAAVSQVWPLLNPRYRHRNNSLCSGLSRASGLRMLTICAPHRAGPWPPFPSPDPLPRKPLHPPRPLPSPDSQPPQRGILVWLSLSPFPSPVVAAPILPPV